MDIAAGTNHWLPAYGFQQPGQLQQVLDNDDGGTMLIAGQQQPFLFLETIIEETSDDLRSESDRSGPAGWPDSDSDTASVIHVPNSLECCDSGSERDLAVPKKRRRQDVEEDQASLSSRSSSLLQFECLERHCEDVFRTSDPFQDLPSPSVTSSFSFDSLESNRWRFSTSPDSLDDNSDCSSASSDDTLHHSSSWSSRSGSFRSRLRSFRSFDSLNLLQPPPPQCPKQPAPQPTSKPQRSAENLSEDSGFGDQCGAVATVASATVGTILEDESSYYSDSSAGAASSETSGLNLEELRGWNVKFNSSCWQSAPSLVLARDTQLAMASSAPNLRGHVTFSPVVSEVSWRDSYSDNEDAEKLEASQSVQKLQIGVPVEATGERERVIVDLTPMERGKKTTSRLGGFFQRFSLRRNKKHKEDKRKEEAAPVLKDASYEDVTIIPLHPPPSDVVSSKPPLPPLPPRSVPAPRRRPDANVCAIDPAPVGLLETDLDSDVSTVRNGAAPANKKAKSLLNLQPDVMLKPPPGGSTNRPLTPADSRAKSMEFLLDKENQAAVQPPENELQKGGAGERVLSEHQLRVQRSLQKLNVPDWYKNSNVARGPEGFLLKRGSDQGWPGLGSKTTSLSSLGSTQSAAARSPTSHLLSPSPTPHVFTRWSTSRLNSGGTSASTSPCGSTRSSFNYRQPYLGWRSQEKLARPRTPAERLAAGLLPLQQQQLPSPPQISHQQQMEQDLQHEAELDQLQREDEEQMQQVPNLSEVRTSIKEVTSAIVHYVSGVREGSGDSLSPPRGADWGTTSTPRGSPRGSSGRLCWLESSFVGSRPLDSPETPLTLTSADMNKTLETLQQQQQQQRLDGSWNVGRKVSGPGDLYLDLNSTSQRHQNLNTHHQWTSVCEERALLQDQKRIAMCRSRGTNPVRAPQHWRMCWTLYWVCLPHPAPPAQVPLARVTVALRRPTTIATASAAVVETCAPTWQVGGPWSASDGPPVDPPPYYVSDTLRRRSEGNAPRPIKQSGGTSLLGRGGRRVSFDMTSSSGSGQQQQQAPPPPPQQPEESGGETVVRCRYSKCGRTASVAEARRTFKTCHNCSHVYCSRECRRAHWERHRKTCLHSRVGALCRQVLATAREDPATLRHLSLLARRGYLAQGRGAVKSFFSSPELAERFVSNGFSDLGEPAFVRWADLLPGEMGADLYSELLRLCKSYNPDTRFVLYVAVCVVSEVPTSGAVKWERQLVSRCAKLRLCRSLAVVPQQPSGTPQRRVSPCNITRDSENPETLILTSLPGCQGQMPPQRAREISFTNIQRHLRQRGVSLRRHFPDVYKRLCAYVEGTTERFTPVTVYPRDALTGKSFMCIIMPDAEPEKLELVPRDSSRVQTIDISLEHDT